MATLTVNGVRDRAAEPSELGRGLGHRVHVKDAALVQTSRAGGPKVSFDGLNGDDVVEIELQDGLRIWSRVDSVPTDLVPRAQRGIVVSGDTIFLPSELRIGPPDRSAAGWGIKALKIVGIDIEEEIADFAAAHVEGQLQPGPGLYQCSKDDASRLAPVSRLDGTGPTLLFLHGTASSTSGSFSGLWDAEHSGLMASLFDRYEGRILAYQHRSLTESPITNALALSRQLAEILTAGAELHLVSHSRGGLVGELLARGMRVGAAPFTRDDVAMFEGDDRTADRDALEELSTVLAASQFQVTRFVRVACPARGTTLADGRLDRYVTILVNLAGLIPGLKGNPAYDALTNLLAGVLKKRTDPRTLPGIEAMMPISPLVRMLNNPDVRTNADLHVLGGDLAGTGVFGRLKTLATDLYYRDDHDIVVNTPAMLGGMERTQPIKYWIDTGNQVTHFHYFRRADTAGLLASALTGSDTEFRTLPVRPSAVTSASYRKRATISKPVVIVLPGIMGSELTVDGSPVWMKSVELARGGLTRLSGAGVVKASGLLPDGYAALCEYLKATHEVMPFPYDWRQSLTAAASALRDEIEKILPIAEQAKLPIRLLAHSMGGLVVRTMLADDQGAKTWERMCHQPGVRFIMLGTPNGGSYAIPAMLIGRDALVKKLALVDLRNTHAALLGTITSFEGVLNLLPYEGARDFFDLQEWKRLLDLDAPEERGLFGDSVASSKSAGFRWALPAEGALGSAKKLAAAIRNSPLDPARVAYVAGVAEETACDIVVDEAAPKGRKVKVMASGLGDGRVLWATGIPKGIRTFYMDTVHGDLANDRRHFDAIVDLLNSGTTSKLGTVPPARRDVADVVEMRDPMPAMIPDEAELVATALGGRRAKVEDRPADTRIAIRVVHDNLTNAKHPVLVSHYRHDVIVAAERYLDRCLGGRLSDLLRMELYPGPINTAVVELNERLDGDQSVHPGAIVAGLGDVGELTPGKLTSTLAYALTMYGADCVGRMRRRTQREGFVPPTTISAPVTAILIGSGEGGVSLADSVRSLMTAVLQANQRLQGPQDGGAVGRRTLTAQIDRVDIFELWQDRAVEGLHALRALAQSPEFAAFVVDDYLVTGDEGQRRVRFEQADGWWQRIRVTGAEDGMLDFEAVTQTARAPARLLATQRELVDGFVQQAIQTIANDPGLEQTLFEMLVPNDFKPYAPDRRKLALMLKGTAAAIPWELIRDGFDRSPEPVAVACGMIRQLLVDQERALVLRSPDRTALVIGNPIVLDARFPPLDGAAQEAAAVAELLNGSDFQVQSLIHDQAEPRDVLSALHSRPWRILHFAAHGVYDFDPGNGKPRVTGLVLNNGLFFTPAEADQLRYVPDLVFINCCHLGQMRNDASPQVSFHKLAANVATQFIKLGSRAVIAAGWAVDDAAAKTFATSFYRHMLDGDLYGDAVLQARRDTWGLHANTNTWGAYQCYGDPSFSLTAGRSASRIETFVSPAELAVWLEQLTAGARNGSGGDLQRLEERVAQTPEAWWKSADLCATTAAAFAELGQFDRAVEYYDIAATAERALGTVRAVEQLASCRVRSAGALLASDPPDVEKASELLEKAEGTLRHLLAIGETSERWSLLGSLMKRRALLPGIEAKARRGALSEMARAYKAAYDKSVKSGEPVAYPLANQLAANVVLSWRSKEADKTVTAGLEDLGQLAAQLAGTRTDAFNLAASAERLLLQALQQRELSDATRARIVDLMSRAMSRGASATVRESMRTQIQFFRQMMRTEFPKDDRAAIIGQMNSLETALFPKA
jgi:hypothetical protein